VCQRRKREFAQSSPREARLTITRCSRKKDALNERISCTVSAERAPDGTIQVVLRAVDGFSAFRFERALLMLTMWHVDRETVRLSVINPRTGSIAYLQGGAPVLELAREIGLELVL
jgi:hypothetical protein